MTLINSFPYLEQKNIHLWWSFLSQCKATTQQWETLAPDEQERALRFKRDRDYQRYVITRSTLRQFLAAYLQISAAEIQFSYGDKGKPRVDESRHQQRIEFNLSHSQDLVLWGFSHDPVGVDVEYVKPDFDAEQIARRFFTQREHAAVQAQSTARQHFFFQLWTRKESCIKATGDSLFEQISQLEIPCTPKQCSEWLSLDQTELHVRDISLCDDYAAAIASPVSGLNLSCFEIDLSQGLTLLS
ncbi:MAG: 4'-phosphopantetheinyl transferase superfamily protein [Cyanobacteria bacterium P01_F01_bin.42]